MNKRFFVLTLVLSVIFGLNAQNKMDIEHLMDGTYGVKGTKYYFKFENNDEISYYDKEWNKHIINKKGEDRIVNEDNEVESKNEVNKLFLEVNKATNNEAFIRDDQVWIKNATTGIERHITTDGDSINIIYGQSVHRNE